MKNKAGMVGPKGAHHIKPFSLFSFSVPLVMSAWCGPARSRGLFLLVWQLQRISLVKVSQPRLLLNRASSICLHSYQQEGKSEVSINPHHITQLGRRGAGRKFSQM